MATFIDEHVFQKISGKKQQISEPLDPYNLIEELSKYIHANTNFVRIKGSLQMFQTLINFTFEQREYVIQLSTLKNQKNLIIFIRQTVEGSYNKINSKHMEILLLKELTKSQYSNQSEFTYYLHNGCLIMTIKLYFQGAFINKKLLVQFYGRLIIKNFHQFHQYQQKKSTPPELTFNQIEASTQFEKELYFSQMISTIPASFDVSQQKSHFKSAQEALLKQKSKIKQAQQSIVIENYLERINHFLFQNVRNQSTSLWISLNFASSFDSIKTKGKKITALPRSQDRKIQDFVYNIVKIQMKDKIPKPIGQGGSSYIYLVKALLTYINSVDFTAYKKKDEISQKLIVVKSLKPEFQQKMKGKLLHEKQIVSKLKGSCSNFIPKYYGTEKDSNLSNVLLMEHVHGEELDKYMLFRRETISLWTKICILINIVQGIRHLVNYDIVHFDIKPINIIICRYLLTKILDFGQAYHKDLCPKQYCPGYTFPYVAPQIYARYQDQALKRPQRQLELSQKQDVYAFGLIMYEVLFNTTPFNFSHEKLKNIYYHKEVYQRLLVNPEMLRSYGRDPIISSLFKIIIKCLHPDPQYRPRFDWIGVSLKLILNSHIDH